MPRATRCLDGIREMIQKLKEKGAAYKIGDDWLETCSVFYQKAGIPTLVDRFSARVPKGFPLGKDIILYFGWYTQNAQGPFIDPAFQFKRGAVAAHIHSYSASTLRTTLKNWSGPLLSRGACAVLAVLRQPSFQLRHCQHLRKVRCRGEQWRPMREQSWKHSRSA